MYEWDESKRIANLEKHEIDFVDARKIFAGPVLEFPDDRKDYGERRIGAFGVAEGRVLFVIYTWRDEKRRLISARKAGAYEREIYYAALDGQGSDDAE